MIQLLLIPPFILRRFRKTSRRRIAKMKRHFRASYQEWKLTGCAIAEADARLWHETLSRHGA